MKVAVSIPDRVFEEAERASKRLRVSRSRLYAQALEEFVRRQQGTTLRAELDQVYAREDAALDPVVAELQARALDEEW